MHIRSTHLLLIWLLGFPASLVIGTVSPGWFAQVTVWGRNAGWQTEIAIWTAGAPLVLLGLLRQTERVQAAAIPRRAGFRRPRWRARSKGQPQSRSRA